MKALVAGLKVGWMDYDISMCGLMDGLKDGWMDACIGRWWVNDTGWMGGWICGWIDEWMNAWNMVSRWVD